MTLAVLEAFLSFSEPTKVIPLRDKLAALAPRWAALKKPESLCALRGWRSEKSLSLPPKPGSALSCCGCSPSLVIEPWVSNRRLHLAAADRARFVERLEVNVSSIVMVDVEVLVSLRREITGQRIYRFLRSLARPMS